MRARLRNETFQVGRLNAGEALWRILIPEESQKVSRHVGVSPDRGSSETTDSFEMLTIVVDQSF